MTELILHHYAVSPFAEKIRTLLGHKQLSWRSVDIPVVMPKPDLLALTGGYRKTPVLQIGCDIYCDTWTIARVIEKLHPERPVFDPRQAGVTMAAARWFDRELFLAAISQVFHPAMAVSVAEMLGGPQQAASFAEDRKRMMGTTPVRPMRGADGRVILDRTLSQLDGQLQHGSAFLQGDTLQWLDLCAYHPLWALLQNRTLAKQLDHYAHVNAWLERIRAHGHGHATHLAAGEAIAIARASEPAERTESEAGLDRIPLGSEVEVAASDYALEPSAGTLVHVSDDELAIERSDPQAGRVVVHFPRIGYRVTARTPG